MTLLAGCSSYHPLPLDQAAVDKALQAPQFETVKIAASKIEHPLLAPISIDGRDGFSPDEIAVIAVITNPNLRALRDQRGVMQAQVLQAGILPNPQLGYAFDRQYGNSDPSLVNGRSLGLDWEITALLGYRDRVAGAKSAAKALELDIAWQEWQTAQAARLAAFRVLSLEGRLPLVRKSESEMGDALALAKKAYATGHMTGTDLAAVTEAWSAAQEARRATEQELQAQRLFLNLTLGRPAETVLKLKVGAQIPDLPTSVENLASLLDGLEKRRLDLVALATGYESADSSLRAAIKAQFPKINLSFAKARDTSAVKMRSYGVAVDLPLFDRNQGQIASSSATRQQLFDEYVSRVAEARSEVLQILSKLSSTREKVRTLTEEVSSHESLIAQFDQAMTARTVDAQAWRDAHNTLNSRRVELADTRQELLELGVALEIASGRHLLLPTPSN